MPSMNPPFSEVPDLTLKTRTKGFLLLISFVTVAFGQPASSVALSFASSFIGYALFWRVLLSVHKAKSRFFLAAAWFAAVQIVQFSWAFSHPYYYIYVVLFAVACWFGLQWGLVAVWIKPETFRSFFRLLALTSLWTLLEWSRLFVLSGMPFNPVGISLSGSLYALQFASLIGVLGLSFWVILTNFLVLRAWIFPFNRGLWGAAIGVVLFPFFFGAEHLSFHRSGLKNSGSIDVVLVQSAFPVEENVSFRTAEAARRFVIDKWKKLLSTLKKQRGQAIDFIIFPEYVVPYGTFALAFPEEEIRRLFEEVFGDVSFPFPSGESVYRQSVETDRGDREFVSNAYIAQTIADLFQTRVIVGLEDSLYENDGAGPRKSESYTSAFHFRPTVEGVFFPDRYEKRVLVPMGEYIPFEWCRRCAARYGISGSFLPGSEAKVFSGNIPFGLSICYEELYSGLMRENKLKGAQLLVNLTNDGWFPNSRLPKQHFDHARLRTVENGIPLIRACNTGMTGAIDSLGQIVGILGGEANHMRTQEIGDSVRLQVPRYHYATLYSLFGDSPLLVFCVLSLFFPFVFNKK